MASKITAYANNFFWLFLTIAFSPLFYLLIFLKTLRRGSGQGNKAPAKILVVQTAKIGDLVCSTPVFREIKKNFPASHLTALVIAETKDILRNNPRVDEILTFEKFPGLCGKSKLISKLKKERYDWAFNLSPIDSFAGIIAFWSLIPHRVATTYQGAGEIVKLLSVFNNYRLEFRQHTLLLRHYLALLKFLGIEPQSEEKEIFITPAEEKTASEILNRYNLTKDDFLVGISCTSGLAFRQWELEKFAQLADRLIEELKAKIIFIGSAFDFTENEKVKTIMRHRSVNAAGEFKLHELAALLNNLKLFVSMDTGPIYIANALGVPVVDIAGPDDMREQSPSGPNVRIVQKNLPCLPCSLVFSGTRHCRKGHLRCVKEIGAAEVFSACRSLLNKNN